MPAVPPVPTGPHDVSPPVPPVRPLPVVPGVPPTHVAPKTEKRTLVVAELRDIRFDIYPYGIGSISFRHPATGETFTWSANSGTANENTAAGAAAVLAELRRAEKVELVLYSPSEGGKEFRVNQMTLDYDSLK